MRSGAGRWIKLALGAGSLAVPLVLNSFYVNLLSYVGIYALVALGIVLLTGAGGLISFGQAAFVGIGAYATAVVSVNFDLSPWLGLFAAILCCTLVAFVLGLISLPLSGHYLALVTIAWGMTIFLLFGNIEAIGGHSGLNDIPPLSLLGLSLASGQRYYYVIWLALAVAMVGAFNLLGSRQGRAIRALRGGDALVESLGVDGFRLRLALFVIAAVLAGVAGWLYAHLQRYVGPAPFDLANGITFMLMAVVGGTGSIWGALVGALVITGLNTALQDVLPFLTTRASNLEVVVYGCLFVLMLQQFRGGIVGQLSKWVAPASMRSIETPVPAIAFEPLPNRSLPDTGTTVLEIDSISKRFGGLLAVNDVSFALRAGEILGLIGPNGAGKTTIFNLISGITAPSSGRILFGADQRGGSAIRALAQRGLARTFQHVKLRPGMSVLENVMLGTYARTKAGLVRGILRLDRAEEAAIRAEAMRQLERVGLAARAHESAGSLPLGQQRILEVARSLAADPILLLLDEPAAGLRRPEKLELARLLTSLRQSGVTILLVEHDMDFVMQITDRIVVMNFGRKLVEGSPAEVRADTAVQEAYLGAPA
jgi:branched-chain amino acid transport system permease protein